jgi:hypothetical protein
MKLMTNRNAVVAFLTFEALTRRLNRRKRQERRARVARAVGLGVLSAGVFAAVVYFWRRSAGEAIALDGGYEDTFAPTSAESEDPETTSETGPAVDSASADALEPTPAA